MIVSNYLTHIFIVLLILFIHLNEYSSSNNPIFKFGKYGSVRVDVNSPIDWNDGSSWPKGIDLGNNLRLNLPKSIKFHNITGYPYSESSENLNRAPRTYSWKADELSIYCQLFDASANPTCTRLAPPRDWIGLNGAEVKVLDCQEDKTMVEVRVPKSIVDNNLSLLRSSGAMSREDIYRMLDKGPWVLAFDLSNAFSKLTNDLQLALGLNLNQTRHIISHCPYLLAQYCRYKGRDVCATVCVLNEVGYTNDTTFLVDDIMRFPSILATPPERLRGWISVLQRFGVAMEPHLFGKMLRRATFMFQLDPPYVSEMFDNTGNEKPSSSVVYEAASILSVLDSLNVPDLDKVIRTQPSILLCDKKEIEQRIQFLLRIFSHYSIELKYKRNSFAFPKFDDDSESSSDFSSDDELIKADFAFKNKDTLELFHDLLLTYPAALSIEYEHMKAIGGTLRSGGLTRNEIVYLIKTNPSILKKSPEILQNLLFFLKSYCGFKKSDIAPALSKFPSLLSSDIDSLKPKVDYFYNTLGGTPATLRRFPIYLSYDLESFIRPRTEFVKTFSKNPDKIGVEFLLRANSRDLCYFVGVSVEDFKRFSQSFTKSKVNKTKSKKSAKFSSVRDARDNSQLEIN